MRVAVYSVKPYDERFLNEANAEGRHEFHHLEARLTTATAALASDAEAVCAFVNDDLGEPVLAELAQLGITRVVLRSAGFNHVDLEAAANLGITVTRVPGYSPQAVAEHCVALLMTLNRKTHRAYNRVREGNFALNGLMGFDLHGKTVGVIGTGKIGVAFADIMLGFGCTVIASDPNPNPECQEKGVQYVSLDDLLASSDVVSLHAPLTPQTTRLINPGSIAKMRDGVTLINTSRGMLIDTTAVIDGLKAGKIGYLGLDVYEEEEEIFFEDRSDQILFDDVLSRLLTFPNVLITGHQGFFTAEAVRNIAETTVENLTAMERGEALVNEVTFDNAG